MSREELHAAIEKFAQSLGISMKELIGFTCDPYFITVKTVKRPDTVIETTYRLQDNESQFVELWQELGHIRQIVDHIAGGEVNGPGVEK